jgi:Protein of unknown function (DUF1826)
MIRLPFCHQRLNDSVRDCSVKKCRRKARYCSHNLKFVVVFLSCLQRWLCFSRCCNTSYDIYNFFPVRYGYALISVVRHTSVSRPTHRITGHPSARRKHGQMIQVQTRIPQASMMVTKTTNHERAETFFDNASSAWLPQDDVLIEEQLLPTTSLLQENHHNPAVLRDVYHSSVSPELWQQYFVPSLSLGSAVWSIFQQPLDCIDVKVGWNVSSTVDDSITIVRSTAQHLVDLCEERFQKRNGAIGSMTPRDHQKICRDIEDAMLRFSSFCCANYQQQSRQHRSSDLSFSIRIVCSYGSSTTKCPQWHIDHVPCRYIQVLYGPGCMFINNQNDAVVWNRINALCSDDNDDDNNRTNSINLSIQARNELLIDTDKADICQSKEGEAIILLGNQWWKNDTLSFRPAVHKSPSDQVAPWQGRILLTMDVEH